MSKQRLIVISFDALIYEDLPYLRTKPNFSWLLENGSHVKRVKSIYPTLTYPCHTTMITGCWPDKHGVINNVYDVPREPRPWRFGHESVRCEDLLDVCKRNGLKTASVGWPVSGNHPSVDYLVNECWPETKDPPIEEYAQAYLDHGTPVWLFDEVVKPVLEMRVGRKQPESSYFLGYISAGIIRKYQPDVLVMHPGVVDSFRHKGGVFSDIIPEALDCCDDVLGMLIQATKDAGVFEETNFVVTSDHGHLNATRKVNLNCLFAQNGLIKADENHRVTDYRAWCYPMGGMSAYVHLSDPRNEQLYKFVYDLLQEKCSEGLWGISQVFTREECQKMHLDGNFSFVVETDGYTEFGAKWYGDPVVNMPFGLCGPIRGDHGYHPDKGPRSPFIACGPFIKRGVVVEHADLIDGAPTYARILGVALPLADGSAIEELLDSDKLT